MKLQRNPQNQEARLYLISICDFIVNENKKALKKQLHLAVSGGSSVILPFPDKLIDHIAFISLNLGQLDQFEDAVTATPGGLPHTSFQNLSKYIGYYSFHQLRGG